MSEASKGIGYDISLRLSKHYSVVVSAKSLSLLNALSLNINQNNGSAIAISCDVRHVDEIDELIKEAYNWKKRLDVVIYNAGAITWGPVEKTPLNKFDLLQAVLLFQEFRFFLPTIPFLLILPFFFT